MPFGTCSDGRLATSLKPEGTYITSWHCVYCTVPGRDVSEAAQRLAAGRHATWWRILAMHLPQPAVTHGVPGAQTPARGVWNAVRTAGRDKHLSVRLAWASAAASWARHAIDIGYRCASAHFLPPLLVWLTAQLPLSVSPVRSPKLSSFSPQPKRLRIQAPRSNTNTLRPQPKPLSPSRSRRRRGMAVPDVDDEAAPRETPPPLDCSAPAPHADALLSVSSFCASPDSDELHRQPDSGAVSPGEVSGRAEAALKTSSPDSLFKTSAAVSRESVASLARPPDSSDPRNALFDDHVASTYVPGSLHLAPDSTIERLVERQGVIPLLRQLAEDLAHRDRELVRVRRRAEERERALKKMLVEVEVSNADIEKRLAAATLQRRPSRDTMRSGDESYTESIDDLMNQAMNEADTFSVFDDGESMRDSDSIMDDMVTPKATLLRRTLSDRDVDTDSLMSNSSRQDSTRRGWKAFFWGQKRDGDETIKGRSTSNTSGTVKRKSIQKDMFAPPEGVIRRRGSRSSLISSGTQSMQQTTARAAPPSFIHTQNQPKAKAVEIAPKEAKSSASMADWSLRRVTQTADEQENQAPESPRPRTQSTSDVDRRRCSASATDLARNPRPNAKAIARRSRAPSISSSANAPTKSSKFFQDIRDTAERIVPLGSSQPAGSTSPGPVEMERIIPHAVQPPTLLQTWNQYYPTDYLTDRFGFIYDKRQRSMSIKSTTSLAGHYQERDLSRPAIIDDDQPGTPLTPEGALGPLRTTPTRREERPPSSGFSSPTTPTAHKPPPGIMARLSGPGPSLTSPASATNALSEAPLALRSPMGINSGSSTAEESTVRLLLGQLSDLHDSLQRDRSIKWNEFLRKIRHERRKGDEDSSKDTPEAALNDGELIGIATVGTEGRGGKQRWKEFKLLVLGGIPVSYRWKVWAECSGATAMRIPGYYDDLLQNGTDDPLVISQIAMDINRTLTDNIFFRKGPGVSKLKQVLLAYSRRNPEVGYCQGMNMITASLLLIMPSEEDAFWVLCSIVERILPKTYFETNLLASRADQQVLPPSLCHHLS